MQDASEDDGDTKVAYDGHVWVRGSKCDACLYSPDRIVSGDRARQLTARTRATEGASFICHKSATSAEKPSICRGWYDAFAAEDPLLRTVQALHLVAFTGEKP